MKSHRIFIWLTLVLMLIILEGFSFLSLKHFESQSPRDFFHEADHYANRVTSSDLISWQRENERNSPSGGIQLQIPNFQPPIALTKNGRPHLIKTQAESME